MVVLPLVTDFIEPQWRASGQRRFTYIWNLNSFNDVVAQVAGPTSLYSNAVGCSITITELSIAYVGAAATAVFPIFTLNPGARYFPYWVTAATTDAIRFSNLNWIISETPIPGNILLTVFILAALPADNITILIDGYIENKLLEGTQPVSLEGYKWPLAKRRA